MLQGLFATPVLLTLLGVPCDERAMLREHALAAYEASNPNGKPWSRSTRESIQDQDPAFNALFDAVKNAASAAFGVSITSITGRELVQFNGDFVPPHVEAASLSAIYWIDCDAHPDHENGDHNGSLVLQSPIGPFGSKALPGEQRVQMVDPVPDTLLIFPSHLLHFGHVYQSDRPSVEVHFELELA